MAEINNRILQIRAEFCENSNKKFADILGKAPAYTSGLCKNEKIGKNSLDLILDKFPEVNPSWLIAGEGSMLRDVNPNSSEVEKLKAKILELEKMNREKDETIARLVRLLDGQQISEKNAG